MVTAAAGQQAAGRGNGGVLGSRSEQRRTATGQQAVGTAAAGQQVGRSDDGNGELHAGAKPTL